MNLSRSTKRAMNLMIQEMCKKCHAKSCLECLYLEQAVNGEAEGINNYLAVRSRIENKRSYTPELLKGMPL